MVFLEPHWPLFTSCVVSLPHWPWGLPGKWLQARHYQGWCKRRFAKGLYARACPLGILLLGYPAWNSEVIPWVPKLATWRGHCLVQGGPDRPPELSSRTVDSLNLPAAHMRHPESEFSSPNRATPTGARGGRDELSSLSPAQIPESQKNRYHCLWCSPNFGLHLFCSHR